MHKTAFKNITSFFPVISLALGNGLGLSSAVISVTVSALIAQEIGWTGGLSTVPYGIQFLALLLATYPSAALMERFGRKPVFVLAALSGVIGGALGYLAVIWSDPVLLCLSHAFLGINLANVNFYRFAALEVAPAARKAQAMSLVVFGGTAAALIGPLLSRQALFSTNLFASSYLGIAVLSVVIIALVVLTPLPWPETSPRKFRLADLRAALRTPKLAFGMACAATGYGAMNLLMISASLVLDDLGCFFQEISVSIQWHVLAMFVPSLFMGRIISGIGAMAVCLIGTLLLVGSSAAAALYPLSIPTIKTTLVLLGIGWNMTYVGGSYLVAQNAPQDHALSVQAVNDVSIGVFAMLGAFLPGAVMAWIGWSGANLLVIASLVPIGVAAFALILSQRRTGHAATP